MFEALKKIDEQLLLWGNSLHSPYLDGFMYYLTEFWLWIPLFVWWLWELYKTHQKKTGLLLLFMGGLLLASDRLSVLIKNNVRRYRPTHNLLLQKQVHTVHEYVGGMYGYVSSHAANVFAIAFFIFLVMRSTNKTGMKISLFVWAFFICYTRIYLGVHYPFDLLSGAALGSLLAFLFYKTFKYYAHE
ncbi:MAG: phosphatase PAP2 family protein [Bacteroidetes bacterium]|nr:phosphatase PAP2 family protein [Bacteroidota bacterium]